MSTLSAGARFDFSKRAVSPIRAQKARGDERAVRGRRVGEPVAGRRDAEPAGEAGRERAEALQADREADVRDRPVGHQQQRGRPLEPVREQVGMRRLAEDPAELAAEVGLREPGGRRHVVDRERLDVTRVHEVPGAQEVTRRWHEGVVHAITTGLTGSTHRRRPCVSTALDNLD